MGVLKGTVFVFGIITAFTARRLMQLVGLTAMLRMKSELTLNQMTAVNTTNLVSAAPSPFI